jgi:putative transcriptional regulator
MDSLQGQLLIASPRLVDPNFARSVIVMVQHNDEGALGLIVNRPLPTSVKEVCQKALDLPCEVDGVLHQGGPCEGPLMVVHTNETQSDIEVFPGVYFTTEREKIEWLMKHNDGAIKFFVGYAGWAAGQLESEIESESWLIAPADARLVLDGSKDEQWTRLMTQLTLGKWIDPERIPDDPSLN